MKKLKTLIAFLLCISMALLVGACADKLATPTGFTIDQYNVLSWNPVDAARTYKIEIRNVVTDESIEENTRKTSYSLDELKEGDYEIRLMSMGGSQNQTVSDWSPVINFHRDYTTGLIYTLINNNTEYMISKVGTAEGDVTIEDVYRGKPVTAIGAAAFRASGRVERVVVGNNVTSIGENAFYNCLKLTSVKMPKSVTFIGESAFQQCSMLQEVELSENITALPNNLFSYCGALKSIQLGDKIQSIGSSAFYSSGLNEIVIPDSVQTIGQYAFATAKFTELKKVEFGSGLRSIDAYAFNSCSALTELIFKEAEGLSIGANAFANCDALTQVELPMGLVSVGNAVFYGSDNLIDVSIPDSVTSIGANAFNGTALYVDQEQSDVYGGLIYADKWLVASTTEGKAKLPETLTASSEVFMEGVVGIAAQSLAKCPNLRSVTLPASVKYLGTFAFRGSPQLYTFITSNNSLETIGYGAFAECEHLGNIRFGAGLKTIDDFAFYNCATVTNNQNNPYWLVPESVERIGSNAFYGTDLWNKPDDFGLIYAGKWVVGFGELPSSDVELASDVKGIADGAFYNCQTIGGISGLNRVEHIGASAFAMCSALSYVGSFYRYMEKIEPMTFYGCSSLFEVGFPAGLKEIGSAAFAECEKLDSIDLSETQVTKIEAIAFYGCVNAKEILLSECTETIDEYAFYMAGIKELVLPDSVREIGERAFAYCSSLEKISFSANLERIGEFAFRDCYALKSVTIPDSVKEIADYAFYHCLGLSEVNLGNGVERIGGHAFYNTLLVEVVLPASVKYVGEKAFDSLYLSSIVMLGDIEYIGAYAFRGGYMTVYSVAEKAGEWSGNWNSDYRPVLWGCQLSAEGYIYSVTLNENTFSNAYALFGIGNPARSGYTFVGWATDPNATEAQYKSNDLKKLEQGTTLYAIWIEKVEESEEGEEGGEEVPDAPTE